MKRERQLRRLFQQLLTLAAVAPGVVACSDDNTLPARPADAGVADAACAPTLIDASTSQVDGALECHAYHSLSCGLPPGIEPTGCEFALEDCLTLCPTFGAYHCAATAESCTDAGWVDGGALIVSCDFCPSNVGRRPLGYEDAPTDVSSVASYFAEVSRLEAASVGAFVELERALRRFGAPRRLALAARRAADDERRHTALTAELCRTFGGAPRNDVPSPRSYASLLELALDNAREGCVRETFGALLAQLQARHAREERIRKAMSVIALDETRHAGLAWEIADWLESRLSIEQLRAVHAAREHAAAEQRLLVREPTPALRDAGVPPAALQRTLLAALWTSVS